MAIYWPTPGLKGRTFKLCVLIRWDNNLCVRSSSLRSVNLFVSWYFEPSQPQRITSGLKQTSICLSFTLHTSQQTTNSLKTTISPNTTLHMTEHTQNVKHKISSVSPLLKRYWELCYTSVYDVVYLCTVFFHYFFSYTDMTNKNKPIKKNE